MKIRTKLLLFLVPLALAAVLLTTGFSRRAIHSVVAGEVAKRGITAAAAVALDPQVIEGCRTRSERTLLTFLTRLKENTEAVSAAVISEDRRTLAHTNVVEVGTVVEDPMIGEVLRSGQPGHRIGFERGHAVMIVLVPVLDQPGEESADAFLFLGNRDKPRLGVVRVSFSLQEALGVSARISNQVLLIIALVCSVVLGLMVVAMGRVLAPVPQLVAATKSVGSGNLGATVPVVSRDEIGELAQSFNRMSRDLADTTVSREFLNNILTHMQDPVLVTHPDGTIRMANESAVRLLGAAGDGLVGRRAEEFVSVPLNSGESGMTHLRRSASNADAGFRTMDGTVVPALVGVSTLEESDGKIQGYIVTGKDITELRRAQDELRQSVSLLRATLDSTADGILVVDAAGRITSYNENFVKIWGIPSTVMEARDDDQALAYVVDQLVDPDSFMTKVRDLYRQPDIESYDVLAFKDGRTIERYSRPQRLGGVSVGRVWSFRDITKRRQAEEALRSSEEQLRQAQKMEAVGNLAGGVAHDFNNILTIMKGYCQLMMRAIGEGGKGYRETTEVLKAAERAASLTRQLLAFSRKQVLQPKVLALNVVVADMERMLRRLIGEDIELRTMLCQGLGTVMADPGQLEQVLLNLAVNARDAMSKGGRITIETANMELDGSAASRWPDVKPGRYVMLSFADSGCGMDEATVSRIFEPFFTTKEQGKGTGLGLSTVYGIVKQSGGSITVESAPGRGTTFRVCLPRLDAQAEENIDREPESTSEAPRGKETVLLVEDEEIVRSLFSTTLRSAGYSVLEATDGHRALEISRGHKGTIDIVVTDVVMPRMGGGALAETIGRERPGTRVLYMSGYTDDSVVRHGVLDAGIPFLQKPFSPDVLTRKVRQVLDSPRPTIA
jgi:PAS domain S-box-containing protein